MKNHFFMAYAGNKRNEVEGLYNEIKDKLDNIDIIIEPFCGTAAFSYYLSTKHPGKFKYILNDNNKYLLELYDVASNPEKLDNLILQLNEFSIDINKQKYGEMVKIDKFENWVYKNKVYGIRPGTFTLGKIKTDFSDMKKAQIINFMKNEKVELCHEEGTSIVERFKDNENSLIFLDPPYLAVCNQFYYNPGINIYEYLYNNSITKMKATILLCLEDNWIINFLFKDSIKSSYNKKYETSKKKTNHLIISNN